MNNKTVATQAIPILLVEDDPSWQEGIGALFNNHPHFRLVATVDSYEEALTAFERVRPKVVLLDWKIKGERDGLAVGQALLKKGLTAECMVVISGSPPSSIPKHPFLSVGKPQIASDLLPLLESLTTN
jgi:DNA-binding NarL/FixJ family response regulator